MIDANSQFFAILTQVGEAKQANADALGRPWLITEMGVGDANGTDPVPDRLQTRLINEWRRRPLNQLKVDPVNPAVIITEQIIPADEGGKWIREIGLYDADGDLVAVANCAPSFKPVLSQGSGRTQIVRMNLIVSSAGNITLKIDPAVVLATRSYVDNVFASIIEVYAQKAPYDGTPGKLAKVGYMGWGSSYVSGPQLFGDMTGDQTIFSGLYRYSPQTIGHPGFGSGYGSVLQASLSSAGGNWGTQLVIDYAFDAIGFRRLSGSAGWQPFQEIWHRGNLKVATQDQTNSGIDDTTFVTPKKFAAGLSALIIQATEAIKGIARVATQSQLNSGVDDTTFVTPKKLRWGFQVLKAQQGYVVFPTWLGGFVVQWGYASIPGVATAVPFALSYPSACYAVVPMVINSSEGADTVELTHAPTKNSFTSAVVSSGASGSASQVAGAFYWLSVGF